jgi:TonB-dependent starch-binding outer membrane protein SusC
MSHFRRIGLVLTSGCVAVLTGCAAPGLPPAGPGPGEVEVGHGTQPEKHVTGSISSLNEEKLGGDRPIKMEEFLRGRVAGLELVRTVNGRSKLRIRGTNSLLSQQEPLIVVDGVPMSTSDLELALAGLTYKDIRQVDVLKDVSSTAIYGLRGAGGVIVINTWR